MIYEALYNEFGPQNMGSKKINLWTSGGYISGTVFDFTPDKQLLIVRAYNNSNHEQYINVVIDQIAAWS